MIYYEKKVGDLFRGETCVQVKDIDKVRVLHLGLDRKFLAKKPNTKGC